MDTQWHTFNNTFFLEDMVLGRLCGWIGVGRNGGTSGFVLEAQSSAMQRRMIVSPGRAQAVQTGVCKAVALSMAWKEVDAVTRED